MTITDWIPSLIYPANITICVTLRMVRLISIELIRLIKCKWQISSLTIFRGNQFLVK